MGLLSRVLDKAYFIKEKRHLVVWHRVLGLYAVVLLVWGLYRLLFRMPVWVEESVLKALVFGLPVFWLAFKRDKLSSRDLGITSENMLMTVLFGLGLGVLMALFGQMGNLFRYGGLAMQQISFTSAQLGGYIILSLVTAFWEQLLFSGYMLRQLVRVCSDEWIPILTVALLFALLHVPALVFVHAVGLTHLLLSVALLVLLSLGTSVLMLRTKNLIAPMMAHALWGIVVFVLG